jgi:hypothetical protein
MVALLQPYCSMATLLQFGSWRTSFEPYVQQGANTTRWRAWLSYRMVGEWLDGRTSPGPEHPLGGERPRASASRRTLPSPKGLPSVHYCKYLILIP